MRVHTAPVKIITIATTLAAMAILGAPAMAGQQKGQAAPAKQAEPAIMTETAGQFYKNVKVLTDVPAYKLHDGMHYITAALGTRCEFCHEEGNLASDKKRSKRTARKMMKMLFAIDKDNFNGRTEVSCYTCHQGREKPMGAPMPAAMAASTAAPAPLIPRAKRMQPPPGTKIPTVDEILANYAKALGGQKALDATTSRVIEIERSGRGGRPPITQEIYEKAPNKLLVVTEFRKRKFRTGYNGAEAWQGSSRGSRTLVGIEALLPLREAQFDSAASIGQYKRKRLIRMAQIGDHQAWVVRGLASDGNAELLYFDTKTGLLLRRAIVYRTVFGRLLFEADYSHYQKTGGVAIPYKTEWWAGGSGWTETVKSVKTNVPINTAEFNPPAKGAAAASGGNR